MVQGTDKVLQTCRHIKGRNNPEYPLQADTGESIGKIKEGKDRVAILCKTITINPTVGVEYENIISKVPARNESPLICRGGLLKD
eukprot:9556771-Karenia_brevis.AAC.1